MADAAKKSEESGSAPASGGGSKIVPVLLGLNSLLLAGVLVLVAFRPQGLGGHQATAPAADAGHDAKADAKAGEKGEKAGDKADKGEKADKGHAEGEKGGEHTAKGAPGPTLRLPDFVVHLRDTDTDRYARISFEVEVDDEKGKEAVTARMPQIRDAFLSYLSDRSADELRGGEGIGKVKGILTDKLTEVAPGAGVRALYVTELVVQ